MRKTSRPCPQFRNSPARPTSIPQFASAPRRQSGNSSSTNRRIFMRRLQILILATLAAACSSLAAEYRTEEKEAIRRTLSGSNSLDVDLVSGSIEVTGDSGNTIRVEGERIIRADDKATIDRAKKEVT